MNFTDSFSVAIKRILFHSYDIIDYISWLKLLYTDYIPSNGVIHDKNTTVNTVLFMKRSILQMASIEKTLLKNQNLHTFSIFQFLPSRLESSRLTVAYVFLD